MNKQKKLPIGSIIGILGGGQLGKMLSQSASQLGFKTHIYDPDFNAPAKQVTNISSTFEYDDIKNLENFANKVDVITYEFENIPLETINFCQKIKNVYPNSKSLGICQDRISEKKFLNNIGVETATFETASTYEGIIKGIEKLGLPVLIKTSRFGYDGKGQKVIRQKEEIEKIASEFTNISVVIEKLIDFELEISIIICRDMNGKISTYDPAENIHQNGILVDSSCRTSDPNIFAAGDCANFPYKGQRIRLESVGNAIEQSEVAAETILGRVSIYEALPWFWSDQFNTKLQIAGLNFGYTDVVERINGEKISFPLLSKN